MANTSQHIKIKSTDCDKSDPTSILAAIERGERIAKCCYYSKCHSESISHPGLAFFKPTLDSDTDSYYCGCYGWD